MRTSTLLLTACLLAPAGLAADWPQWQGPDRTNVAHETGLLKSWPPEGPKLLWTFDQAGTGYSGPAVVAGRLYTLGAEDGQEYVYCIDLKNRKKLWSCAIGTLFNNDRGGGPRGTPTVDGDLVFAISGQGNLACVRAASGELVWKKGLRTDLGGTMMSGWGYSESPLVDGDKVVCTPGGSRGAVAALDKKSGEVIWRSKDFTDRAGYASLVVSEAAGVRQYVQMTGNSVAGLAAEDGRPLWRFARSSPVAAIPTPLCSKDYVYVTSGYGTGCTLLKLAPGGDKLKVEEVYSNKIMANKHDAFVLVDGYVYGYSDGKGWVCQDFKSGKLVWQERGKLGKGSVTYADGRLCCYPERGGTVALVEATPKGWHETGRFELPERSKLPRPRQHPGTNYWTHPVVANGRLYLRDQDLLFCYDVKDSGAR